MDMQTVTTLIGSLGFPIACVIFLWKYINSTMKEFTQTMQENTLMLQKLYERLSDKDDNDK